jgi:hypothetical protein
MLQSFIKLKICLTYFTKLCDLESDPELTEMTTPPEDLPDTES